MSDLRCMLETAHSQQSRDIQKVAEAFQPVRDKICELQMVSDRPRHLPGRQEAMPHSLSST